MKTTKYKLAATSILAATAILSMLMPATASAVTVSGNAIFTFDNDAITASVPAPNTNFKILKHWDASENATLIDGSGGTNVSPTGTTALTFAVNTNSTDIVYAGVDRVTRFTDMQAATTSTGQIGLSGALQMSGDGGGVFPKDWYMEKVAGTWNVQGPFTSFGDPTLFTLQNVSESLNTNGELLLTGDIYWATAGYTWAALLFGDGSVKLGTFSLAPVPVPAAVWLFGTGLLGLVASGRKKLKVS